MKKITFKSENSLAQQCFDQLQDEIISGVLKPGQKIKVEPLKERFLIGQSPIREALSRLVSSGLVEVEENKGFRVASISEHNIKDVYASFTAIENLALEWAIKNGNDDWKAEIIAQLYKLSLIETKKEPVLVSEWAERNYQFHVALISGCKSPTLMDIRKNLYLKFDRYCRLAFKQAHQKLEANHEEHKKLAEAVLSGDVAKAKELMTYHINAALPEVIKIVKENNSIGTENE